MTTGRGAAGSTGMGQELREARLARGLTIDDCQRATRIARRYLEALEAEDFPALPAPVFARGFLRSYAQYLGLDATALVAKFPGEPRPPEALPTAGAPDLEEWSSRNGRGGPGNGGGLEAIPTLEPGPPAVRLGPWLVAAFVVLVVLAGVVAVVTLGDESPRNTGESTSVPGVAAPADLEDVETVAQQPALTREPLPDLTQRSVSEAVLFARRSGAPFAVVEIFDTSPAGTVLDQVPEAGSRLDQGDAITLVVSRGPRAAQQGEPAAPAAEGDAAGGASGAEQAQATPGGAAPAGEEAGGDPIDGAAGATTG